MTINVIQTEGRTRLTAARAIARVLLPAEDTIDQSIAAGSLLLQRIAQARLDGKVDAEAANEAIRAAGGSVTCMIEARDMMVTCHRQLAAVRDRFELRSDDVGCTPGKIGENSGGGNGGNGVQQDERIAA